MNSNEDRPFKRLPWVRKQERYLPENALHKTEMDVIIKSSAKIKKVMEVHLWTHFYPSSW